MEPLAASSGCMLDISALSLEQTKKTLCLLKFNNTLNFERKMWLANFNTSSSVIVSMLDC